MLIISIVVVTIIIMNNVTSTEWNVGIYGLFVFFIGYDIFSKLKILYKVRRSLVCDGRIISYEEKEPHSIENQQHYVDISFISPADNKEYLIKTELAYLPKDMLVDVIVNATAPQLSKAYGKYSLKSEIIIMLAFLFFTYELIENISYL